MNNIIGRRLTKESEGYKVKQIVRGAGHQTPVVIAENHPNLIAGRNVIVIDEDTRQTLGYGKVVKTDLSGVSIDIVPVSSKLLKRYVSTPLENPHTRFVKSITDRGLRSLMTLGNARKRLVKSIAGREQRSLKTLENARKQSVKIMVKTGCHPSECRLDHLLIKSID